MKRKWTEERIEKFINMYPNESWEKLTEEFGMKKSSLITIASSFGITRSKCAMSNYTNEEDTIIKAMIEHGKSFEEISNVLTWRTVVSIQCRAEKICAYTRLAWTEEEDEYLTNLYEIMPVKELMEYFPTRSKNSIKNRAQKLGLHAYVEYKRYSEYENNFIKTNYSTMSDEEMGQVLGRSRQSIKNHRNALGMHRIQKNNINYENVSVYVRRHTIQWKKDSMKSCNFKCIVTGDRFDVVHHLVSLNTILKKVYDNLHLDVYLFDINKVTEEERNAFLNEVIIELSNYPLGVCLRKDIHMQFHNIYGYGNNTIEQFYDFIDKYYPDVKFNFI